MRNLLDFLGILWTQHFFLMSAFLYFTETIEEFEHSIMQKKMKIPKMSTKNAGNSIENHFGEERLPLRHKKVGFTKLVR